MSEGGDATTRAASLEDLHRLVVRGAEITVLDGPDAGRSIRPNLATVSVIGTGQGADLRLTDTLVSRRHVEIHCEDRSVRLVDRHSRNGPFFHGARFAHLPVTDPAETVVGGKTTRIAIRVDKDAAIVPFSKRTTFGHAIAQSEAMRHVFRVLETAAAKDNITVLLEGDSGTGKEVLAEAIHHESPRRDGPFVIVDCGSIAPNLIESELFGHERGAFTGAIATHQGAFERAHGGTIFLDELGELPLDAQPKLLRALESRSIRRVGGKQTISFDVRVVAATNRRLKEAVRCKEFREDLFYRLAVVHVVVPRLADRRDDILPLAEKFLRQSDASAELPEDLKRLLAAYDWPGNVRELRNVIDRFATFRENDPRMLFGRTSEPGPGPGPGPSSTTSANVFDLERLAQLPYVDAKRLLLDAYHRTIVKRVVDESGGVVPKAAERLSMSRTNLYRVLQEIGAASDDE